MNPIPALSMAARLVYDTSLESPTINIRVGPASFCNACIAGTTWATSPAPPSKARWKTGTAPSAHTAMPAWICLRSGRRSLGWPNFGLGNSWSAWS